MWADLSNTDQGTFKMSEIFALKLSPDTEKTKFNELLKFVGSEKRLKINRFVRHEDAQRALFAEILIRYIICNKLKVKNDMIVLNKDNYGKPFLKGFKDFHYNLSHSQKWIVCAVDNLPIGIDVEAVRPIETDIARRFFSREEYENLISKEIHERTAYFFELWTLKESYIKAWGKGLSVPLDSFTVRSNAMGIEVYTKNEFNKCFFKQYQIDPKYKMAVCAQKEDFPDKIVMKGLEELWNFFN